MTWRVPFADLRPHEDHAATRAAIERVIARGWFVLGPEVEAFEAEFAAACGARYAVGVGNGTDAIALLLRAAGVGHGDEVIVPAMTAAFTALAVVATGATPVIADIDGARMTLCPRAAAAAVTPRTRAIVPVHLYGQAADLDPLYDLARAHGLLVVEDCCQAHGATHGGQPVGTRGVGGAFSFYPTKNLGGLGDGGAIVTNDRDIADRVRRLRNGGQTDRYRHVDVGVNSRLDELQAAVLRERLPRLAAWTTRRRTLARLYREHLPPQVLLTEFDAGHVYHLFPVRVAVRDAVQTDLARAGIQTLIHYPVALGDQPALAPFAGSPCVEAARAAAELLSLPLYPSLTDQDALLVALAASETLERHVHA